MNVKDLILRLKEFPDDTEVVCHDGKYDDFWEIEDVYTIEIPNKDNPLLDKTLVKISPFMNGDYDNIVKNIIPENK